MKGLFVILAGFVFSGFIFAQEVKWYTIEEAIALNEKSPKKIVIDVYTDWCGWCKVMDRNTFGNKIIAEYLNENYYPVKFNAEQKENITLGGYTYKYISQGRRGYHELAAALLNGNLGYPSVVFLTTIEDKLQIIHIEQRYIPPKDFDQIINFIGDDLYKEISWNEFLASYQSPIEE